MKEMDEYPCILYLDEDEENLLGFETSFSREFEIYTASSNELAVEILMEKPVKVFMVDYKIPEEDNAAFLLHIRKKYPLIVFVLITAYVDLDKASEIMRLNIFHNVVQKPWGCNELKITLNDAVEKYYRNYQEKVLKN